jgi:hypothetical protein
MLNNISKIFNLLLKIFLLGLNLPVIAGFFYVLIDDYIFKTRLKEIGILGSGPIWEAPIEWNFKAFIIYTIGFYLYVLVHQNVKSIHVKLIVLFICITIPGFLGGIQFNSTFYIALIRSLICNSIFYALYFLIINLFSAKEFTNSEVD